MQKAFKKKKQKRFNISLLIFFFELKLKFFQSSKLLSANFSFLFSYPESVWHLQWAVLREEVIFDFWARVPEGRAEILLSQFY